MKTYLFLGLLLSFNAFSQSSSFDCSNRDFDEVFSGRYNVTLKLKEAVEVLPAKKQGRLGDYWESTTVITKKTSGNIRLIEPRILTVTGKPSDEYERNGYGTLYNDRVFKVIDPKGTIDSIRTYYKSEGINDLSPGELQVRCTKKRTIKV